MPTPEWQVPVDVNEKLGGRMDAISCSTPPAKRDAAGEPHASRTMLAANWLPWAPGTKFPLPEPGLQPIADVDGVSADLADFIGPTAAGWRLQRIVGNLSFRHPIWGDAGGFLALTHAELSPDGRLLKSSGWDEHSSLSYLWDVATGRRIAWKPRSEIWDGPFTADGTGIVNAVSVSQSWEVVDWRTGERIAEIPMGVELPRIVGGVNGQLEFFTDGRRGAVLLREARTISVADIGKRQHAYVATIDADAIRNLKFSANGEWMLVLATGNVFVLDARTGRQCARIDTSRTATGVRGITDWAAISNDGRRMAIASVKPDRLHLWEILPAAERLLAGPTDAPTANVNDVRFSPDDRWLVAEWQHGRRVRMCVYDTATGELAHEWRLNGVASTPAFTPDSRFAVIGECGWADIGRVRIFDLRTGAEMTSDAGLPGRVAKIWLMPDSRRAVAASKHGARLIDLANGREWPVFAHGIGAATAAYAHPASEFVVLRVEGHHLAVFDCRTERETLVFSPAKGGIGKHLQFSADGTKLGVLVDVANRKIFDLATGAETVEPVDWDTTTITELPTNPAPTDALPTNAAESITATCVSPDGRMLIAGTARGLVLIFSRDGAAIRE